MRVKQGYQLGKTFEKFFNENVNMGGLNADDCFILGRALEIIRKSVRFQEINQMNKGKKKK